VRAAAGNGVPALPRRAAFSFPLSAFGFKFQLSTFSFFSMSSSVIRVEQVSKAYRLGAIGSSTLREDLSRHWARLRGKSSPAVVVGNGNGEAHGERRDGGFFWALRDVNIEVKAGETLAIIGRNGAGKSTLLKILSRITAPTSGLVKVKGRIASLLEVGTGFNPDLTGRENVFLNGAILGMTVAEIRKKFDEIVDFSGVEEFIDTPVKRYSSGMSVRLAFAVAAHLDPEILILDEVLAVGDAAFQRKCLGKMEQAAKAGRTVLFVSHTMVAVQSLCRKAVLLVDGRVKAAGLVGEVVPQYLAYGLNDLASEKSWPDLSSAPGNEVARITGVRVGPAVEVEDGLIRMETPVSVEVDYRRMKPESIFHLTFHLVNENEVIVLTTGTGLCPPAPGRYQSRCVIPGNLLNSGGYRLKLLLVEDHSRGVWLDEAITSFSVEDLRERKVGWMGREPSAVQVPLGWKTDLKDV
jgi:lipopolysaccharide transport system ATP-binding protein